MTRRCFLATLLVVVAASLSAHEKFKIVGTIVKVQATQLDVIAANANWTATVQEKC